MVRRIAPYRTPLELRAKTRSFLDEFLCAGGFCEFIFGGGGDEDCFCLGEFFDKREAFFVAEDGDGGSEGVGVGGVGRDDGDA